MKTRILGLIMMSMLISACYEPPGETSNNSSSGHSSEKGPSILPPTGEGSLTDFSDYDLIQERSNVIKVGAEEDIGDPFIFRFDGTYYLYSTSPYSELRCYSSSNLRDWNSEGIAFNGSTDPLYSVSDGKSLYAPEIRYYNGLFYLIFRGSSKGLYVATSDNPAGPFSVTSRLGDYSSPNEIDQSYFIASDEKLYVYASGFGNIVNYTATNMTTLGTKSSVNGANINGKWTEGPYMIERYGKCYLTYTGTHYKNDSYRVDYMYVDSSENLQSATYQKKEPLIVSTENDFAYLGHSMTVLGPDLDSYYLVYHNSKKTASGSYAGKRRLNYSRLSFDGAIMRADNVRDGIIYDMYDADYMVQDATSLVQSGSFSLSDVSSKKAFSVEFTNIGNGRMIFSYQDENNYGYLDYKNNKLIVGAYEGGVEKTLQTVSLVNNYSNSVYHTFRLQYSDEEISLYFDDIEKLAKEFIDFEFDGGKCGYYQPSTFSTIGHTSMSNVAHGSSDAKTFNEEFSFAANYDKDRSIFTSNDWLVPGNNNDYSRKDAYTIHIKNEGDRATYRLNAYSEGDYQIALRVNNASIGKKIKLKIDDGNEVEYTIGSKQAVVSTKVTDSIVILADVPLEVGPHYISLVSTGDEVTFGELIYDTNLDGDNENISITSLSSIPDTKFHLKNVTSIYNGLVMANASSGYVGLLTKAKYANASVKVTFRTEDTDISNNFGIIMNAQSFTSDNGGDNDERLEAFQGMYFGINGKECSFKKINYQASSYIGDTANKSLTPGVHTMELKQSNNTFTCYVDDVQVFEKTANLAYLSGKIGVFGNSDDVTLTNIVITNS